MMDKLFASTASLARWRPMLVSHDVTDLVRQADQLKILATVDGMTGVFNRRHFLALAESNGADDSAIWRPMSLIMLDIDRFKSINDDFGHYAGDQVIVQVADICRTQKRKSDIVARFGGEEFLILLPEAKLPAAQSVWRSGFDGASRRRIFCSLHRRHQRNDQCWRCGSRSSDG